MSSMKCGSRLAVLLAAMALAVVSVGATAQTAGATPLMTCTGTHETTSSPGLTEEPQTVQLTVKTNYTSCLNLGELGFRTGISTAKFTLNEATCGKLLWVNSSVGTINWSVGTNSVWEHSAVTVRVSEALQTIVQDGTITSGEFAGQPATGTLVFPPSALGACSEPGGLKSLSALATFEVLP